MNSDQKEKFIAALNQEHDWPVDYLFKFIAPKAKTKEFEESFKDEDLKQRASRTGKYISYTFKKRVQDAQAVIEVYLKADKIEGVMPL